MQQQMTSPEFDVEQEYRAIEATLLETATGRWFLAEHGRRSRRLDNMMLASAIDKLQDSIRQPPALLGQLQAEIGELRLFLAQTREELMARRVQPAVADAAGSGDAQAPANASATGNIIKAAESMHELAWGLQAQDIDPVACEAIAKHASIIYAMSMQQAQTSERVLALAAALDNAGQRLAAVLETIAHELEVDDPHAGANGLPAFADADQMATSPIGEPDAEEVAASLASVTAPYAEAEAEAEIAAEPEVEMAAAPELEPEYEPEPEPERTAQAPSQQPLVDDTLSNAVADILGEPERQPAAPVAAPPSPRPPLPQLRSPRPQGRSRHLLLGRRRPQFPQPHLGRLPRPSRKPPRSAPSRQVCQPTFSRATD